ncbi:MAG: hypothetical protein M0P69_11780 [Bacteroidales bacterium]|nr:hypothetical protein [Bacteroidales bacterium]
MCAPKPIIPHNIDYQEVTGVITIKTSDGAIFEGNTWERVVIAMKLDMFVPPKTKENYMAGVAQRQEIFDGQRIQYHDNKSFLYELLRVGVITEIIDKSGCKTYYLQPKAKARKEIK